MPGTPAVAEDGPQTRAGRGLVAPAPRVVRPGGYCLNFTAPSVVKVISVPGLIVTW
jgi:hypothetical protein